MSTMGRHLQQGFTIIEVVLVMAITALLMVGIISSSNNRINDQHYREGVESFRDFLAGSFEDVSSVKNDTGGRVERCRNVTVGRQYSHIPRVTWRGAAPCFFAGKELTFYGTGNDRTRVVVRSVKASIDNAGRAIYSQRGVDDANRREITIDWGVQARRPKPASNWSYNNYRIRLIKHPTLGIDQFQESLNGSADWRDIAEDVVFCMSNPYDDNIKRWYAVRIAKDTVNATGITTLNAEGACGR